MNRQEVYKLIDGERAYQDSLGTDRVEPSERPHDVGGYLTLIRSYSHKADMAWTDQAGAEAALAVVRKIAAIAVACMERHGAPERNLNPKTQVWDKR